jgi:hypothetical protein
LRKIEETFACTGVFDSNQPETADVSEILLPTPGSVFSVAHTTS